MTVLDTKIDEVLASLHNAPWKYPDIGDYHQSYFNEVVKHIHNTGLWLEFGVYRGRSISYLASKTTNTIYGFDSFDGLHENWDKDNPRGAYSLGGIVPSGTIDGGNHDNKTKPWPQNVKLIKGYFEHSLPPFLEQHQENAAFVHIDSDLYSSATTVLTLLKPRIISGTIICFDDLCSYPDCSDRNHEIKAFAEFLLNTGHTYKSLAYYYHSSYSHGCFVVE